MSESYCLLGPVFQYKDSTFIVPRAIMRRKWRNRHGFKATRFAYIPAAAEAERLWCCTAWLYTLIHVASSIASFVHEPRLAVSVCVCARIMLLHSILFYSSGYCTFFAKSSSPSVSEG